MSDDCRPFEVFHRFLPENDGKKQGEIRIKYELFTAKTWALVWSPGDRRFFPPLSSDTLTRKEYWDTMIRVRINGRWYRPRGQYQFMTRAEFGAMLLGEVPDGIDC